MKPKTFNQLWNPQTIKLILRDYQSFDSTEYLCYSSPRFLNIWNLHKLKLQKLALEFKPDDTDLRRSIEFDSGSCLFYDFGTRQTRIDFLNHEIKRLTK